MRAGGGAGRGGWAAAHACCLTFSLHPAATLTLPLLPAAPLRPSLPCSPPIPAAPPLPTAGEKETLEQRAARLERAAAEKQAAAGERVEEAHRKKAEVGGVGGPPACPALVACLPSARPLAGLSCTCRCRRCMRARRRSVCGKSAHAPCRRRPACRPRRWWSRACPTPLGWSAPQW